MRRQEHLLGRLGLFGSELLQQSSDPMRFKPVFGFVQEQEELCWNLGDAVIRRRSVLACW